MKPEMVLGLKNGEEPKAKLQEWLKEYAAMAAFPGDKRFGGKAFQPRRKRLCAYT